jgi:hypothetical protein
MGVAATTPTAHPTTSAFGFMDVAAPTTAAPATNGGGGGGGDGPATSSFGFMSESVAPVAPVAPVASNMLSAFDGMAVNLPSNNDNSSIVNGTGNGDNYNSNAGSERGLGSSGNGGNDQQTNDVLKKHEADLETLEQQCASIQTIVYQFEAMRTEFLNAKSDLAQLNGNLERLQSQGIDTITVQHLNPSTQDAIKAERKILTQRVAFLFDQISVTHDYMSNLNVA